jgi:hypothetical protein
MRRNGLHISGRIRGVRERELSDEARSERGGESRILKEESGRNAQEAF